MPKLLTEIIVVRFHLQDYENETVAQVLACTDTEETPYHLTVWDNGFKDEHLSTVWNKAIERSEADYIVLLNSDAVVEDGWLPKLLEPFKDKHVGATGPISNNVGTHQSGFAKKDKNATVLPCHMLSGFCLVFPKRVWEEVGGFNEKYHLYGEDNEFCAELVKRNYKLLTLFNVHVFHHGSQSVKKNAHRKDYKKIREESVATLRRNK